MTRTTVVATHIFPGNRACRAHLVCEVFPGVFVEDGGGVYTALSSRGLYKPLPEGAPDRTFTISGTDMADARDHDRSLRAWDELTARLAARDAGLPRPR